jgi:hypothetical protein
MQTTSSGCLEMPASHAIGTPLGRLPGGLSAPSNDAEIRERVWTILASLYPKPYPIERRRDQRYPYPHLIRLTAAEPNSVGPATMVVAGKNLSEHGISFYHLMPLALRRVIVTLEAGNDRWLSFLTDLTWCRFTHHGWYESGGVFLQAVEPPPAIRR